MITFKHAKRLVLTSAEIMVREPEKHGYLNGSTVPPVYIKKGRSCFCLMGGAAALLVAERGQTYTTLDTSEGLSSHKERSHFMAAWGDLLSALPNFWSLVEAHDMTEDVNEMYAKVKALLG
jgi:hypothetical protein